jgi:hypothetical protein
MFLFQVDWLVIRRKDFISNDCGKMTLDKMALDEMTLGKMTWKNNFGKNDWNK